jgi:hypothetical protein
MIRRFRHIHRSHGSAVAAMQFGRRRGAAARWIWLLLPIALAGACGGASSEDCTRVCAEAVQSCTDKSIDTCVSRCEQHGDSSAVKSMHCGGHSSCCGGLCCLGFYYGSSEQESTCGPDSVYSCD